MSEPDNICGATTRDGAPCKRVAGWGTSHLGEGRCKAHGGADGSGRPIKHGLYSKAARSGLAERIQRARNRPIGELEDEVAVLRALLDDYLSDVDSIGQETVDDITKLVDAIRRGADTVSKIDARDALTARHVEYLQAAVADVLTTWVPEENVDEALHDLRSRIETDESALDI
jgi:hypothetical protein